MSDKDTSTLQSYVDSATGAVQSAIGSLTGNTQHEAAGEAKKDKGAMEHDLSHTSAKVGPVSMSSSGAVTTDDPNRQQGSWNQSMGAAKESLGGIIGSESLKQQGIDQNRAGKDQEAQGQLNDLTSGIGNRVGGAVGGIVAGITGDREEQARQQDRHDIGKTQQRGVETDLQKQADAQQK